MSPRTTARAAVLTTTLTLWVTQDVSAEPGVAALLQFAEQYQQDVAASLSTPALAAPPNTSPETARKAKTGAVPLSTVATSVGSVTLRKALQGRERELSTLRAQGETLLRERDALRTQLAAAQAAQRAVPALAPVPALPDLMPLQGWLGGLRAAWRGAPDVQRAAVLVQQAQDAVTQARAETRQAQGRVTELTAELHESVSTLCESAENGELALPERQTQQAQAALQALQQRFAGMATSPQANDASRLAYAAGTALGRDVLGVLTERQQWGVAVAQGDVLAGIVDAVSGKVQLPQAELDTLVGKADAEAEAARTRWVAAQAQRDKAYVAQFSQQRGVKPSPMGFWYRVDYAGQGALKADTVIDLVVREQLTDGTVIQDMEGGGKVLSQPLSAFPALFREALGYLGNHGALTMVVPPALAYGEAGYPPKVLPNATLIYTLRIDGKRASGATPTP